MKIGQFFPSKEKIGSLTESGGVITLAESHLKIGGLGVTTDPLSLTLSGLNVGNMYMLYVVLNAGTPKLVSSTNYNSVGPAGYDSWVLVGAFYPKTASTLDIFVDINDTYIEYVSNSSTTNSSDTTLFAYGSEGSLIPNVSQSGINAITKRINFLTPVLSTDKLSLQINRGSDDNDQWINVGDYGYGFKENYNGTARFGIQMIAFPTYIEIRFFGSGVTPTIPWSGFNSSGYRYRVVKKSNGAPIKNL